MSKRRTKQQIEADNALIVKIELALDTNPRAVSRAIKLLNDNQTAEEQACENTLHNNGIGFTSADAKFGSYLARYVNNNNVLSGKFLDAGRRMAKKYVRTQLLTIAKQKRDLT